MGVKLGVALGMGVSVGVGVFVGRGVSVGSGEAVSVAEGCGMGVSVETTTGASPVGEIIASLSAGMLLTGRLQAMMLSSKTKITEIGFMSLFYR